MMKHFSCLTFISLLSACGGGSTGSSNFSASQAIIPDDGVFSTYTEGLEYVFDGRTEASNAGPTSSVDVPIAGMADYRGAMFLGQRVSDGRVVDAVVGEMTLEINLGEDTFSGGADDFIGIDGTAREGEMTISNGTLLRNDGIFDSAGAVAVTADVKGSIEFGLVPLAGQERLPRELSGTLAGAFAGPDAQFLSGLVNVASQLELAETGDGAGPTVIDIPLEGAFLLRPEE